ncbi:nitroreductase [Solemya pervernicosa gill symbiont]|uniref:Nitroreductase n=2 Tax=Gammaproteobacteria incertae sedis TaxID=118884 RepID=A0A1T2L179_9GAMM|nr:nitroreductase [Candidatus Reidiella endopervernicosa]OOZ38855.1 nitroreductase [Solemya pervernicosa gill symbiont]QKQ26566.1 nitroreductase [Candidatus Reidiella endopervernicosa]
MTEPLNAIDAIKQRSSTRAYLDQPVGRELITTLLDTARYAPSGVNIQPWQVAVVTGKTKRLLGERIIAARDSGATENPDYAYYPSEWREPYKQRRKATGLALYSALKISREDRDKQREAWYRNYRFFDAPVGLVYFIDSDLSQGAWIDMGLFLQSVMVAAQSLGLATCPQAALAEYPDIVRETLGYSSDKQVVCGMALGYADPDHPVNSYRTEREPVESFTQWFE